MKHELLLSLFFAAAVASDLHAQNGTLDNSFDGDGLVTTDVGVSTVDVAAAVVVQADGKTILGGTSGYEDAQDLALVRYMVDGSLDASFGAGGKATLSVSPGNDVVRALVLQPDGKILAGGYTYGPNGITFVLARFAVDGTPDPAFGTDGVVITDHSGGYTMIGCALALQADGKILFAGGGNGGLAVVRYNTDGTEDLSFGQAGLALCSFGSSSAQANAVAVQPDGLILLAGYSSGGADSIAMARFTMDGLPDANFGAGGKMRASYFTASTIGNAMALTLDGHILVAGYANDRAVVMGFDPQGNLDAGFGDNGVAVLNVPDATTSVANAISVLASGRVLLAGNAFKASTDFLLVRLNSDGALDTAFGTDGIVTTDFNSLLDIANAMAVQPDGSIVLAGRTNGGSQDQDFAAARYNQDIFTGVAPQAKSISGVLVRPDPVTSASTLTYTLLRDDVLSIDLFDAKGAFVQHVVENQQRSLGAHTEALHVRSTLPAGSYSLVLRGGASTTTVHILVM